MKLSTSVVEAVRKAGVQVYYADRSCTKLWNKTRDKGDPVRFGGWYWNRIVRGVVVQTDETDIPFRSQSAAIRDAFVKLQLRHSTR